MGIKAAQRDRLERAVSGAVLLPGEGGYADATRTWDLAAGSCPPVALVAASAADIAAGARWAKENDLDIAMLNTGHGALDHNAGALVINASRVNQAAVDSSTRRATVGPGTCWADVSAASAPLGLIGLAGASPGVGVIGYTLGGGLSPIGRTFGFASDRVVRMTVLDAECRPVRVDDQDAELFWALRGEAGWESSPSSNSAWSSCPRCSVAACTSTVRTRSRFCGRTGNGSKGWTSARARRSP